MRRKIKNWSREIFYVKDFEFSGTLTCWKDLLSPVVEALKFLQTFPKQRHNFNSFFHFLPILHKNHFKITKKILRWELRFNFVPRHHVTKTWKTKKQHLKSVLELRRLSLHQFPVFENFYNNLRGNLCNGARFKFGNFVLKVRAKFEGLIVSFYPKSLNLKIKLKNLWM